MTKAKELELEVMKQLGLTRLVLNVLAPDGIAAIRALVAHAESLEFELASEQRELNEKRNAVNYNLERVKSKFREKQHQSERDESELLQMIDYVDNNL